MKNKKIILKFKKRKYALLVRKCNFFEKILGLMVFKSNALLLFDLKHPHKFKIHSFFCNPFIAVYTDEDYNVVEILAINDWRPMILPKEKFCKLIEIPKNKKYQKIISSLLKQNSSSVSLVT